MSNQIGVLVPRSTMYPVNFDLINGIKLGAARAGIRDLSLKIESIGVGGDDKIIQTACEQMLFSDIKIVVGYINPTTAEKLQPLFASAGALLIALDAGYQFPLKTAKLENVITISLEGALCGRIVSKVAAGNGHLKVAYLSSFYDAGYRIAFAFARGLEDAGGSITFNHITKLKRSEFTLDPLIDHLKLPDSDCIMAALCGDMFFDFCTTASGTTVFNGKPVYGSHFACDEYWLKKAPYPGADVRCAVTWLSPLDNEANKDFKESMEAGKANINLFSLLGWEASLVIAHALQAGDTASAVSTLNGYEGPRGTMTLDKSNNKIQSPVYLTTVQRDETNGNCTAIVNGQYNDAGTEREAIKVDIKEFAGQGTSWFNVYGCIDS